MEFGVELFVQAFSFSIMHFKANIGRQTLNQNSVLFTNYFFPSLMVYWWVGCIMVRCIQFNIHSCIWIIYKLDRKNLITSLFWFRIYVNTTICYYFDKKNAKVLWIYFALLPILLVFLVFFFVSRISHWAGLIFVWKYQVLHIHCICIKS